VRSKRYERGNERRVRLNGPERAGVSQRDVDQWNAGHGKVGQSDGFDVGRAGSSTATEHFVQGCRRQNVCGVQHIAGSPEGHVQLFGVVPCTWSGVCRRKAET